MAEDLTAHDGRRRRCPMLGHDVPFSYCRSPASALPCRRVFDCWWETFDVVAFIRGHFSEADIAQITAPRPDKAATIIDLIRKAREGGDPPP